MYLLKVKTINTPIIRQPSIFHLVPDVCSTIQEKALFQESSMLTHHRVANCHKPKSGENHWLPSRERLKVSRPEEEE
jgi:hypothetical protein